MLVIWGRDNSVNVQKPLWCLDELGLPYERRDAGGAFGIVDTPDYRRLNPNGLVPTMVEDDGFVLWESNAIVRYLTAKHAPGTLWPTDLRARAEADRWMDWQNAVYWPAIRPLFWNIVRTPADQRDPAEMEASRLQTIAVTGMLEAHLADRVYVAGDAFTMGDIPIGCGVWRWMALPIERPAFPHVQRWFDRLAQRPAFVKAVMQPLS